LRTDAMRQPGVSEKKRKKNKKKLLRTVCHETAAVCHNIDEAGNVAVIDIGRGLDDFADFSEVCSCQIVSFDM